MSPREARQALRELAPEIALTLTEGFRGDYETLRERCSPFAGVLASHEAAVRQAHEAQVATEAAEAASRKAQHDAIIADTSERISFGIQNPSASAMRKSA